MEKRKPHKDKSLRPRSGSKANTRDALALAGAIKPIPAKWRKYYDRLVDLHVSLAESRHELNEDALEERPTFSTHMADAGTDEYDRDMALGMLSSEQDAIYEVEQALERISNGTYGICELTGRKIDPARLEALPWTRFTAQAEAQLEKERKIDSPRLGPNNQIDKEKVAPGREGRGDQV
jgi:RNA polymerase-binding transcription factor DksA